MGLLASVSLALGFYLSTLIYQFNIQTQDKHTVTVANSMVQQTLTQIDGLILTARQLGDADPLGWAVSVLNQGSGTTLLRVKRVFVEANQTTIEESHFNPATGIFQFIKMINPGDRSGVSLVIQLQPARFLALESKFLGDIAAFALFVLFSFLSYFILYRAGNRHTRSPLISELSSDLPKTDLKNLADGFTHEALALRTKDLTQSFIRMSHGIKEIITSSRDLAVASAQARDRVVDIHQQVHQDFVNIQNSSLLLRHSKQASVNAEINALNLVIEANRMGDQGKRMIPSLEELHRNLQKVRQAQVSSNDTISRIEKKLIPLSQNTEIAQQAFNDLFEITARLNDSISKTKEVMTEHHANIRLKPILAVSNPTSTIPPEPLAEPSFDQDRALG